MKKSSTLIERLIIKDLNNFKNGFIVTNSCIALVNNSATTHKISNAKKSSHETHYIETLINY